MCMRVLCVFELVCVSVRLWMSVSKSASVSASVVC